jgi:hypothetical protein
MSSRLVKVFVLGGFTAGTIVGSLAWDGSAGANPTAGVIRPDQTFFGLVNGSASGANIKVACSQAVRPGEMGHPVSGQSIAVRSPSPSTVSSGDTGGRGRTIIAGFVTTSSSAPSSVTFTHYGSQPLPTTLLLPCLGSGTIVFSARPTSSTARSETMAVTYIDPCPGICADNNHDR